MRPGKVWHLARVAIDNPHYRRDKLMPIASKGREALDRVQQQQVDRANQLGENHALEDLKTAIRVLQRLNKTLDRSS